MIKKSRNRFFPHLICKIYHLCVHIPFTSLTMEHSFDPEQEELGCRNPFQKHLAWHGIA